MRRPITLVVAMAVLLLTATSLTAAGGPRAKSPVGAWAVYYEPGPGSEGDPNTTMSSFDRGGTVTGAAWTDPWTNAVGSWEKISGNAYRAIFYVMIPEAGGILKIKEQFRMLSKDEMEGDQQAWWVVGSDPLGEEVGPIWWGTNAYKRIRPEPLAQP